MVRLDVLFVMGTKPRVGKTLVAMTLLRMADKRGLRAAGMKPVETGCPYTDDHDLWARDGDALRAASRSSLPPLVTSPYRFGAPGDPVDAARRAGMTLTLDDLAQTIDVARADRALLIVEGPGGIDTRVAEDGTTLDLAERMGGRIILVADGDDDRAALEARMPAAFAGTIVTHTASAAGALLALPTLADGDDALTYFEASNIGATLIEGPVER